MTNKFKKASLVATTLMVGALWSTFFINAYEQMKEDEVNLIAPPYPYTDLTTHFHNQLSSLESKKVLFEQVNRQKELNKLASEFKVIEEARIQREKELAEKRRLEEERKRIEAEKLAQQKKVEQQRKVEQQKKQTVKSNTSDNGGNWMTIEASYYTSNCAGCSGITATGYDVRNTIYYNGMRIIATDPRVIPLGSIVEVKTHYGTFKAISLDTGGAIKGKKADVLVSSRNEALKLGRHNVQIRILK